MLQPGDRLESYELLCVLAQGGMGTVWLARTPTEPDSSEQLVAIKTILPVHSQIDQFRTMFLDEARIASKVNHENVARIFDIAEDRGTLYFVMEFIEGEPLRKIQRDRKKADAPFPMAALLHIIREACRGLQAVHDLRGDDGALLEIVHRDVSPQNVLVTTDGTVKVIDFGVAKARDRLTKETTTGAPKGKLDYMPIEQAQGCDLDRRADVYALGAVLYDLLMGHAPRDSAQRGHVQVLHDLAFGVPYPPLDPAIVPAPVAKVIDRALSQRREDRYGSCKELEDAITAAMKECGLEATRADVAEMVAEHSGHRVERLKKSIEMAERMVEERKRMREALLQPGMPSFDPGQDVPGYRITDTSSSPFLPRYSSSSDLEPATLTGSSRTRDPRRTTFGTELPRSRSSLLGTLFGTATLIAIVAGMTMTTSTPTAPPASTVHNGAAPEAPPLAIPTPEAARRAEAPVPMEADSGTKSAAHATPPKSAPTSNPRASRGGSRAKAGNGKDPEDYGF
jgi:serine/threonine protein kinase